MLDIFEGTLDIFDKRLLVLDGSVSLPSMSFLNDRDSGFYRIGANSIGLSLGGALVVDFRSTGIDVLAKISFRKATDDAVVEKIDTGGVLYLWNRADAKGLQIEFANNALAFSATGWAIRAAKADASTLLLQAQNAAGGTQTVLTIIGAATVANSYITAQVGGTWTLASGQTWTLPAHTISGTLIVSNAGATEDIVLKNGATTVGTIQYVAARGFEFLGGSTVPLTFGAGANVNLMILTTTGRLGIGLETITAVLHLKAGTAAASTAPLKLTAGTNLTTPEAGAVEWNGTNLFITQADGTRKTIAYV